jgi:hypothetical protein
LSFPLLLMLNESLNRRQVHIIGLEAIHGIADSSILVIGLGGLGPKSPRPSSSLALGDLASNFCFIMASIHENRAIAR